MAEAAQDKLELQARIHDLHLQLTSERGAADAAALEFQTTIHGLKADKTDLEVRLGLTFAHG